MQSNPISTQGYSTPAALCTTVQAGDHDEQYQHRLAALERDVRLLKAVLAKTRSLRVLLDSYDLDLARHYELAAGRVQERLGHVLLAREELTDAHAALHSHE